MDNDLPEQLRDAARVPEKGWQLLEDAADEIERLRFSLQQIADGNIGAIVRPGETNLEASYRVARGVAADVLKKEEHPAA